MAPGRAGGQDISQQGRFTIRQEKPPVNSIPGDLGDTIKGRFFLGMMNNALWHARTLRFTCSQYNETYRDGNINKRDKGYSVWLKKNNLARVELRDLRFPDDGTNLIYDGKNLWSWFIGKNLSVVLDRNTVLGEIKNVYMTRDISAGSSLSHDMVSYGTSVSMPVLYLNKFFGYSPAIEAEGMLAGYQGIDSVEGMKMHHIKVVMMGGQRIADYWLAASDYLPRKMEEKLSMNASNYYFKRELWSKVAINEALPDSLFAWEPPENWREYTLPDEEILMDSIVKKRENLYDTFTGLTLIDGGTFNLRNYKGQMVLIVFWRLGCPPCRKEMPVLQHIFEKYKAHGIMVVGFNHVDNEGLVREYLEKNGISYPNILDPSPHAKKIYDSFRTNIVPLNCLIDLEGNLFDAWYGFDPKENEPEKVLQMATAIFPVPE